MCLSFFLIDSKGIPFSYSFLTWGNTCVTINSSHHHCHRHHRGLGHGSAEKEQQWWIKSLIYRDLRRAKLVFGCRRGLYLSISLSTHHTNEVDIAYLYFLPFPPFFLCLHISSPFLPAKPRCFLISCICVCVLFPSHQKNSSVYYL